LFFLDSHFFNCVSFFQNWWWVFYCIMFLFERCLILGLRTSSTDAINVVSFMSHS
jgi:hypothetical protein